MAKPNPNLSFGFVKERRSDEARYTKAIRDWTELEKAYHNLGEGVRNEIEIVTWKYARFAESERSGVPLSEIRKLVNARREAAKKLQTALSESSNPNANAATNILLNKHFKGSEALAGLLNSLVYACDSAEAELNQGHQNGHRQGEAWQWWIRTLTDTLQRYVLPTEAGRKGEGAFTALVWAIQQQIPVSYAKHMRSRAALGQAINRAR
jgi:hypothetical protein